MNEIYYYRMADVIRNLTNDEEKNDTYETR